MELLTLSFATSTTTLSVNFSSRLDSYTGLAHHYATNGASKDRAADFAKEKYERTYRNWHLYGILL